MTKPKTLLDLLDGNFSSGYAEFKEIVDYTEQSVFMSNDEKAFAYLYRLISVAMIEGLNRGEEKFNLDPTAILIQLWGATGAALATVNGQAFDERGFGQVRKQTRETVMSTYQRTIRGFLESARAEGATDA